MAFLATRQTMNPNMSLQQLVLDAQQSLPKTSVRQQALEKLMQKLMPEISSHYRYQTAQLNSEMTEEAMQNLWLYVCEKIETYDTNKGTVMAWINNLLKWRILDQKRLFQQTIGKTTCIEPDSLVQSQDKPSLTDSLRQIIEEDQDQLFQYHYFNNNPQLNFQQLAQLRLSGISWQEIAEKYKVSEVSLRQFWCRAVKRFAPILKQSLQE